MADNTPEFFDAQSIARIEKTVHTVERWDRTTPRGPSGYRPSPLGFWAMIDSPNGSDGINNKYSWTALAPNASGGWQADNTLGSGLYNSTADGNIPAACIDGCIDIPWGSPVFLYPAKQAPLYAFDPPCGVQPATIKTFNANGVGTAYVGINSSSGQVIHYTDISGGVVQPGTNCLLSYCAGTPGLSLGTWLLISIGCAA